MGELYNPFPKLPKNIRQIGERDPIVKLYVEDYVNTYLKHLYPVGGQDLRVGVLLGSLELINGMPYIYVDGALEMEEVTVPGQKVEFSEMAWKKVYQSLEELFPKHNILGWFLCGRPGDELSPLNYWKEHVQYFQGSNKFMYMSSGTDGDEVIYITSEDGFYKLQGYSIYYERNQMMQDYMVLRKDVKRIETDTNDKVIKEFRKRMDEHKEEATDRHQTIGLLRGMCMAMSIVILAGGIVLFNNYEHMKNMESVIASAMPAKAEQILIGKQGSSKESEDKSGVIVEEADGDVYPTNADNKETMTETLSEGANETAKEPQETQVAKEETKAQEEETKAVSSTSTRVHVVKDGETLFGICMEEYHDVNKLEEICELNGLEDENHIVSGQKLLLP